MKLHSKIFVFVLILGMVGLACSLLENNTGGADLTPSEAVPVPTEEDTTSPIDSGGDALPRSLYFLSDMGTGGFQVWRLEKDSITQTQVTSEAVPVTDFDVSPLDGRVAYLVNNQIFVISPDGSGRALLVDGGPADETDSDYHFTRKITGLRWSPNGGYLAFGQHGINLYSATDGALTKVIPNNLEPIEGFYPYPQALYTPHTWSPDGTRLLVEIGFYEGSTLGVLEIISREVIRLGEHIVCCYPYWSWDSRSVLVGSPFMGIIPAGLWRYDAITGEEVNLVPHTSPDDTLNFVGWPMELPNGDLQYFFTNTAAIPSETPRLTLVRTASDGISGRTQIRQEDWDPQEALWAPDGSLVVVVEPYVQDTDPVRDGTIILIDTLFSEPVRPLVTNGYKPRWGP
jgi:dipeptidyl aminopeptidase/acylaminoacyl peptidase